MLTIVLDYDPDKRELTLEGEDGYAGATIDNISSSIQVNGLPNGYDARLDFKVQAMDDKGRMIYPHLILNEGYAELTTEILSACGRDWKLPLQLVLRKDDEVIASRNILSLNVSPSIDSMGSAASAFIPKIAAAHIDVAWNEVVLVFTTASGHQQTITIPWEKISGMVQNNDVLWSYLSQIATLLPYQPDAVVTGQYVYWNGVKAVTKPISQDDVTGLVSEIDDILQRLNALSGAYIYIGTIDIVNPTQQQLTDRAMQLKGTAPIVGWVIVDSESNEWYWNGTLWDNMGQHIINEASSTVAGIMKLYDTAVNAADGPWSAKVSTEQLALKANETQFQSHITNEDRHVTANKQTYWNGKVDPEEIEYMEETTDKGAPDGYAGLDSTAKVPKGQLPADVQYTGQKTQANGYPSLDSGAKVPKGQLPADVQYTGQKGIGNGYAGLDNDAKVPKVQLPSDVQYKNERGVANGYAVLGSDAIVPKTQLPADVQYTGQKGQSGGYLGIENDGYVDTKKIRTGVSAGDVLKTLTEALDGEIPYYDSSAGGIRWRPLTSGGVMMGNVPTYADLPEYPANNEMWYVMQDIPEHPKGIYAYSSEDGWINVMPGLDMVAYQLVANLVNDLASPNASTYPTTQLLSMVKTTLENAISSKADASIVSALQTTVTSLQTSFNTHNSDNVRHITASERMAWDGKATGADIANAMAGLSSVYIPLSQRGVANGVPVMNGSGVIVGDLTLPVYSTAITPSAAIANSIRLGRQTNILLGTPFTAAPDTSSTSAGFIIFKNTDAIVTMVAFSLASGEIATRYATSSIAWSAWKIIGKLPSYTANRVMVSGSTGDLEASAITVTQLQYLANVTSDIQAQFNGKLAIAQGSGNARRIARADATGNVIMETLGTTITTSDAIVPSSVISAALNLKSNLGYGSCTTAVATVAKVASVSGYVRQTMGTVKVLFTTGNTANNPTLNVNSTGASAIRYKGAQGAIPISANETVCFVFTGTYWDIVGTLQSDVTSEATARANADTTLQTNIDSEATARANADGTIQTALNSHTSNTSNPHATTKAQVGLGNVDNTSDANKPISTATQTALNAKQAINLSATNVSVAITTANTTYSALGFTHRGSYAISGATTAMMPIVIFSSGFMGNKYLVETYNGGVYIYGTYSHTVTGTNIEVIQ